MPSYADLMSVVANMQDKAILLKGDSIAFLLTALGEYLEKHFNWNGSGEFGLLTDNESDDIDAIIARTERALMGNMTGCIQMSIIALEGALECNGAEYLREEYPELYAAMAGTTYIVDEDTFKVPNFDGKFPVGAYAAGYEGGEETHTLTLDEIPEHAHSEIIAVDTVINGGLEAPAAAAVASIGTTGLAGLGMAHNNIPPFHTARFYIWT